MPYPEKTAGTIGRACAPHWVKSLAALAAAAAIAVACARPAEQNKPEEKKGKHEYKDIKPETYPFPAGVKEALPGLLGDSIYVYREIAPTVNLVSYEQDYSREGAVNKMVRALLAMAAVPELRQGIEFWIIQVQPRPEKESEAGPSQVVVWGVMPAEVDRYRDSGDLAGFIRNSEYLLVDDQIIPRGDDRLAQFPGLELKPPTENGTEKIEPEPQPEPSPAPEPPTPDGKPVE